MSVFAVRHMQEDEMMLAVDWAAAEGWNPGLNDAACFWAADRQGFLLGLRDGQPVGCISAVSYGSTHGFLGFYIVRPEWRGRGYGLQLWQAAMNQLAGRIIGLDGVTAQQENYKKSGFRLAYRNIRYGGVLSPAAKMSDSDGTIWPANEVNQAELAAYDSQLFFAPRPAFLQSWLTQPGGTALAAVRQDALAGYGIIRPCRAGFKIGPLFADDPAVAERLLSALAATAGGEQIFLDVPEVNDGARSLAERYGMSPVFETARMYTGREPNLDVQKIFGVTTFELG